MYFAAEENDLKTEMHTITVIWMLTQIVKHFRARIGYQIWMLSPYS